MAHRQPPPVMGTAARLHGHDAAPRQPRQVRLQSPPSQPLALDDVAVLVHRREVEDRLRQVDAHSVDLGHGRSVLSIRIWKTRFWPVERPRVGARGDPFHWPLAFDGVLEEGIHPLVDS